MANNRGSWLKGLLRLALATLPVSFLVAGAANHFRLVHSDRMSPWLGAGFGMFSTTDVGSTRRVFVTAITRDGEEYAVTLGEPLEDLEDRARALPDRPRIAALAEATQDALSDQDLGMNAQDVTALRIEIWRTGYEHGTLRPSMVRIAEEYVSFANEDVR